jgi:Na+-transporting NADH:ubiquinone oxidoreductase subunit NqrB
VLRKHVNNPHVVTRASISVASLSRVKGNATWMGPAGACDALMTVMQVHHSDRAVSKFLVSAMGNLCIIENNRERLGALGACERIVASALQH